MDGVVLFEVLYKSSGKLLEQKRDVVAGGTQKVKNSWWFLVCFSLQESQGQDRGKVLEWERQRGQIRQFGVRG